MVIASMKPGIASWSSVASPLAASVETTLPRSLYTLKFWLAADCVGACCPEWHPASAATAINEQVSNRRITDTVYYRPANPLAARNLKRRPASGLRATRPERHRPHPKGDLLPLFGHVPGSSIRTFRRICRPQVHFCLDRAPCAVAPIRL